MGWDTIDDHLEAAHNMASQTDEKEMWNSIHKAQSHLESHSRKMIEGGDHKGAIELRKKATHRINRIVSHYEQNVLKKEKQATLNDLLSKISTDKEIVMKIPLIEIAKSKKEIEEILTNGKNKA